MPHDHAARLGIIAGGGDLAGRLVRSCRAAGRPVFVLGLEGHADPAVVAEAGSDAAWIRLGAAGKGLSILRDAGVTELVMVGPVSRPTFGDLMPDWRTARFMAKVGPRAFGDDGFLRAVIGELEAEGFTVRAVQDLLDDLVAPRGVLTRAKPDEAAWTDIRRGLEVARGIGLLDVGQAVVIQQGLVLGVEAIEGTDALLARCGLLRRSGPGGILVKVCKPGQERRADMPTVGIATVANAFAAGLRGIAVEAAGVLVVDREAVAAEADRLGLFVVAVEDGDGP